MASDGVTFTLNASRLDLAFVPVPGIDVTVEFATRTGDLTDRGVETRTWEVRKPGKLRLR